ncbi:undecaprenyl-diphosphate phosphatase [Candidatus Amarobacter glycogenicus]|uniref:undecaprenyl-diphosphate phosphatase n=1 Tax=Candidatus Amarobacter glycogenicus TaxID=3140699 RepID=UPI0031CC5A0C
MQGATEFLPVSSSGHLVLVPAIFDITAPDLTLIGLVHFRHLGCRVDLFPAGFVGYYGGRLAWIG